MIGRFIQREWQLQLRNPTGIVWAWLFFIMVVVIAAIALGPNPALLQKMALPLTWVAVLLAVLLAGEGMFSSALNNGWIEQLIAHQHGLSRWVMAKLLVHGLSLGLGLLLLSGLVIPVFNVPAALAGVLLVSIVAALPSLILFTALAHALTASVGGQSLLAPLLAMPFLVSVIIFATGMVNMAAAGLAINAALAAVLAISMLCMVFLPLAIAYVLQYAYS